MNGSALEKLAPLSGAVWFVLLAVGAVLIGIYDYLPSPESITESLTDNADMASVGGYVGVLGVFFLIWFGGSVRGALAEKEPRGRLSEIAFGGALAAALAMGAGFATLTIAAQRAGSSGGSVRHVEWDYGAARASMPGRAGGSRRSRVAAIGSVPDLVWVVSVVVAIGCLSPVGYFAQVVAMLWVVAVSVWLYAREVQGEAAA